MLTPKAMFRSTGGPDDEFITADRGTVNLNQDTARFENVVGSFGGRAPKSTRKLVYTTSNPFIFTGRVVIKKGPFQYRVIGGTMTSCELPQPDWRILASDIDVDNGQARAKNGYFKLLGVPVLYLPYVTHPVNTETRQTGLLIPVICKFFDQGNRPGRVDLLGSSTAARTPLSAPNTSPNADGRPAARSAIAGRERTLPPSTSSRFLTAERR